MEPLLLRNVNSTKTFLEFTGKKILAFNMKYNVLLLTMLALIRPFSVLQLVISAVLFTVCKLNMYTHCGFFSGSGLNSSGVSRLECS